VFIAITQLLFVYCVATPIFQKSAHGQNVLGIPFLLLCFSSICIAAAGYIINDYFDLNIDKVNKPDKLVVERIIHRRWTIIWHFILSITGIAIGFYLDYTTGIYLLGIANLLCVILLFVYSLSFKKKLLIGNILISLLTAWTIMVVTWCERSNVMDEAHFNASRLLRVTFLYAGFAFIISLIREAVKDLEDMEGDRRYGCKTMPIAWGTNATKVFIAVWLIVLIAVLLITQIYSMYLGWWLGVSYAIIFIIFPLIFIFRNLFLCHNARRLSPAKHLHKACNVHRYFIHDFFKYYS